MVGGHCNLPDSGHQAETAAVTDGEWSPGATGFAKRADRIFAHTPACPRAGSGAQNSQLRPPGDLSATGVHAHLQEATRSTPSSSA
jgi:hypothetical protein